MNCRSVNGKKIKELIKSGLTHEELCERFGCTGEELEAHIRTLFKNGADDVLRDIEKNKKKARPKKPRRIMKQTTESAPESEIESELDFSNVPEPESVPEPALVSEPASEFTAPTTAELREQEEGLSGEVMAIENSWQELMNQHRENNKKLREIEKELEELNRTRQSCLDRMRHLASKSKELVRELNDLSTTRREKLAELESVRKKIEEMNTVSIYIFSDGRIVAPDNPDFILEDEGYLILKDELLAREECQDLRVRDITTLARVKIISEKAEKFSLVFEDQALESVFFEVFEE